MSAPRLLLIAWAVLASCQLSGSLFAHPPAILNEAAERAIGEEITAFRKAMAEAIAARNAAKLREMYAASFTHTHASAKTDNRDARIASALAGEPLIETAPHTEIAVRAPNDWVAIVSGTSPIKAIGDGRTYAVKWIAVYTRRDKTWVLAASQATRGAEIKP
jgi:hypothetical protein